jgi:hypothetical protein
MISAYPLAAAGTRTSLPMTDDQPTAGWGRFEGEKLLIGNAPTLVLVESDAGGERVRYAARWWPNGPSDVSAGEDPPSSELFAGRGPADAWKATVEVGRQTKARITFDGMIWEHTWRRLDSAGRVWADRARAMDETLPEEVGTDVAFEAVGRGGVAVEFEEAASLLGGTEYWEFTPDGMREELRRFGMIPESNEVRRDNIAAVPIVAAEGEQPCRVAVVGEGLCKTLGPARSRESAAALRHTVLKGLAGEYLEERLVGVDEG